MMIRLLVLSLPEENIIKQNQTSSLWNESPLSSNIMLRLRVDHGFASSRFML